MEKFVVKRSWIEMAARAIDEGCDGWDLRLMCTEEERKILDQAGEIAQRILNDVRGRDNTFVVEIPDEKEGNTK